VKEKILLVDSCLVPILYEKKKYGSPVAKKPDEQDANGTCNGLRERKTIASPVPVSKTYQQEADGTPRTKVMASRYTSKKQRKL
jgi:hypothetical protein